MMHSVEAVDSEDPATRLHLNQVCPMHSIPCLYSSVYLWLYIAIAFKVMMISKRQESMVCSQMVMPHLLIILFLLDYHIDLVDHINHRFKK